MSVDRFWIAEVPGRYVKTMLVKARTRKEAEQKLRGGYTEDIECIGTEEHALFYGRILREDSKQPHPEDWNN